jgi:hypothetical protein
MKNQILNADTVTDVISDKIDFTVEQRPLFLEGGIPTPAFANVRTDNGLVLGVTSERYTPVQNVEIIETAERIFGEQGVRFRKIKESALNGGAKVEARYIFPDLGMMVNGNEVDFVMGVRNSFNGQWKIGFDIGLFRLICSNGMRIPAFKGSAVSLKRKHSKNALGLSGATFQFALDNIKRSQEMFNAFGHESLTQRDGHRLLNGLVNRKAIAGRMANKVREIWENPKHREDQARNVWNLYNAVTQHLTHEVAPKRFELAERVGDAVVGHLASNIRNLDTLFAESTLEDAELN